MLRAALFSCHIEPVIFGVCYIWCPLKIDLGSLPFPFLLPLALENIVDLATVKDLRDIN